MFYFSENSIRGNHAGTKARNDVEKIVSSYGGKPINSKKVVLRSDATEKIYSNITNRMEILKYFLELLKIRNQIVLVQYPMLSFDKDYEYLAAIAHYNKLVLLVHDVHGLKRKNKVEIAREILKLNLASAVIVHNRFMEEKLKKCGLVVSRIYSLDIFDYLYEGKVGINHISENGISFAGNLEKSNFFRLFCEANPNIMLHLYGQKFDESLGVYPNIQYCGNYKPDEIPGVLIGKYGLIWDGDKIDTCAGIFGEYNRYNTPHKLSLYITAGMPVIVWRQAAIAEYVVNNDIGIVVDSLNGMENTLNNISEDKYKKMQKNILKIQTQLSNGNNLKKVLYQLEYELGK